MSRLEALLPFGLRVEVLLAGAVTLAVFASFVGLWRSLVERDRTTGRIRAMASRRAELQRNALHTGPRSAGRVRAQSVMARIVARLQLAGSEQGAKTTQKLARAGLRSREALVAYLFAKLAMPIAGGAIAFVLVYLLGFGGLGPGLRPVALAAGVLLGFYSPEIVIANATTKRQKALQQALPDALDLLVICAEAGLSLDTALNRVAAELAGGSPELAEELGLTGVELNFLPERRQALLNLGRRVDLPAMRGVITTLIQTEKYGTPLSQSLRVLSGEFREQRMLKAEEKAARLPAILTVPMIVFILPTLFIVLIGPAMINVYDSIIKPH